MKNLWKWLLALGIVLLVGLVIAFFVFRGTSYGWMPMMGYRAFSPMNGLGLVLRIIMMAVFLFIPFALIALAVFGLVALLHRSATSSHNAEMHDCVRCGKPLQADWKVCPYCGKKVK
jgi:hypothetical protein